MTTALVSVEQAITQFPKLVEEFSVKELDMKESSILSTVRKVANKPVPVPKRESDFNAFAEVNKKKIDVMNAGIQKILAGRLMKHFPALDDSIFALRRFLSLEKVKKGPGYDKFQIVADSLNKNVADKALSALTDAELKTNKGKQNQRTRLLKNSKVMEGPLFMLAKASELDSPFASENKTVYRSWRRTVIRKVSISAKVPSIPEDILKKEKLECLSAFHDVLKDAYADKTLGDVLESLNAETPEFFVMWIPTANSLNVNTKITYKNIVRDPVLLMKVFGRNFVVAAWDIKEEEGYDNYLREFSEGDIGKILK